MELDNCENIYTSCACNRYPHCLDWNRQKTNLICFGSSNNVVLYDLDKKQVVSILSKHSEPVNSVRWIYNSNENGDESLYIISSSVDKTCIIWQNEQDSLNSFKAKYILSGSIDSIIVAYSILTDSGEFISIASSNDQSIRVWVDSQLVLTQSVNCYLFDLKLFDNNKLSIPGFIVLTAGSNETVNISRFYREQNSLELLISLKGHQDWIKSIDLFQDLNGNIMVASGSQDFLIRVYQIKRSSEEINLHQQSFEVNDSKFVVDLDTVLAGHEAWVTEVKWHYGMDNKLYLLSSSMDKTILLWEQPNGQDETVWNEKVRFGEVGGNSVIGFLGCSSIPSLGLICGYSYNGAVHFWKQTEDSGWITTLPITGHFSEVTDLVWEPSGQYFLTCSNDQTTRLHSCWSAGKTWHEIGRPQIHGYDLKCLAMAGRLKFVSGADEKVMRIFNATKYFVESIQQVSGDQVEFDLNVESQKEIAECAIVPALGLSNSAVYDTAEIGDEFRPKPLTTPPTEELLQNTLWPESQKLYGHGFEIFAIAVNHRFTLLASACKASTATHASIILWDLSTTYKKLATLVSHNLTVTQLRFSPNDKFLLSVSRDRTWALFDTSNTEFPRIAYSDKRTGVHSRIIWDCAWTPDSRTFLTSSRDKTVVLWNIHQNLNGNAGDNSGTKNTDLAEISVKPGSEKLTLEDSITSVDIHSKYQSFNPINFIACFALDNGKFFLYSFSSNCDWTQLYSFEKNWHTQTVNRVRFSSKIEPLTTDHPPNDGQCRLYLTTCSNDKSVKLFRLTIRHLISS